MDDKIQGACLCGSVTFELDNAFRYFHLCHCTQCQKMTGSAHASNLFTVYDNIQWISGVEKVKRYDYRDRDFSNAFCLECGSHLPYTSKSGKFLIVPAGSLNRPPHLSVQDNIFWCERANWYDEAINTTKFEKFPE